MPVEGLTKAAALEASAFGVRVTAIAPGPIATGMLDRFAGSDDAKAGLVGSLPLKRAGAPEEVARVIMFAASEAASYMTDRFRVDRPRQRESATYERSRARCYILRIRFDAGSRRIQNENAIRASVDRGSAGRPARRHCSPRSSRSIRSTLTLI